jgi:hypothetical protein
MQTTSQSLRLSHSTNGAGDVQTQEDIAGMKKRIRQTSECPRRVEKRLNTFIKRLPCNFIELDSIVLSQSIILMQWRIQYTGLAGGRLL